jgi:lipopolysaccharide/colanic/teichoic acid biosynthesis glycosyltransferase
MVVDSKSLPTVATNLGFLGRKRIVDVLFTLLILIPLSLVIAIVAICICLDSKGPVFFRQRRVGQNGKEFTMLKFRSMYVDNDDSIHREAVKRYMNGESIIGEDYKLKDDPRITRVGRFIRKTSIDELPQFFNVLRGEMTLVGPRPPLPYEVEAYSARDWIRLSGRPGLTGSWQVYGRSRVQFQEMVDMDIIYLQQQSTMLDLKLIFLTPIVMLSGRGGY